MENYYVIHNGEGETTIEKLSRKELLKRLEENYYGRNIYCFDKIPDNKDANYWAGGILIIKGTVVAPTEERVITKYNID